MNIPESLKYTKEHEWIKVEGEEAYIGITDFAQGELGDIVFIEVETVGDELDKEEVFGTIEAVKTVSDMYMPISGEVLEFNQKLESLFIRLEETWMGRVRRLFSRKVSPSSGATRTLISWMPGCVGEKNRVKESEAGSPSGASGTGQDSLAITSPS